MQLAILVVLIIIAVLIAPWLLGLIAAAAATFGVFLSFAIAAAVLAGLVVLVWLVIKSVYQSRAAKPEQLDGPRKACKSCQMEIPERAVWCPHCNTET